MTDASEREFVLVRDHAESLSSGASLAPAGRVGGADLDLSDGEHVGADQWLVDEGVLVDVEDFDTGPAGGLTGAALKARAAELEIEGRTGMKADELREAIAEREAEIAGDGDDHEGSDPAAGGDE